MEVEEEGISRIEGRRRREIRGVRGRYEASSLQEIAISGGKLSDLLITRLEIESVRIKGYRKRIDVHFFHKGRAQTRMADTASRAPQTTV